MSRVAKLASFMQQARDIISRNHSRGDRSDLLGQLVARFFGHNTQLKPRDYPILGVRSRGKPFAPAAEESQLPASSGLPPGRNTSGAAASSDDDDYDDIELLGRGGHYDPTDWATIQQNEVRVVSSSNVYSYYFEPESPATGILYVTFLDWEPGTKSNERSGPGPTYAYYDVSNREYENFNREAAASAGKAVWDYCRVRGTVHEHQHRYQLIQVAGDYIPRKATRAGFRGRTLVAPGLSPRQQQSIARRAFGNNVPPTRRAVARQFFKRSTLPNTDYAGPGHDSAARNPNRGDPSRGAPNRGSPNRGNR